MEGDKTGRLSDRQKKRVMGRAVAFRQRVVAIARERADGEAGNAFFPEVFRIASELIEQDTGEFCDRAAEAFDEIEAHGQEPELDDDWVDELTGENDSFYFSTDSLVQERETLPNRKRGRKPKAPDEVERITRDVENAIVDDMNETGLSFEQALAVAHAENVDDWVNAIRRALENSGNGEVDFWGLHKLTHLRPAELFLGLLLGQQNWELGQPEFYGQINVCQKEEGVREGEGREG